MSTVVKLSDRRLRQSIAEDNRRKLTAQVIEWPPQRRARPVFDALYWLMIGLGLLLALAWRRVIPI